jgi:mannose-6-phosphate isomerase-like protein (cupin superfamily)
VNRLQAGEHFMTHLKLKFGKGFRVRIGNRNSQSADMVLAPGEAEGGAHNRHRGADQWLFVISGSGTARVNEHRYKLSKGVLRLIYVPPAYRSNGEPLPRGRKQ